MGSSASRPQGSYTKYPALPPYGGHKIQYQHLVFIMSLNLDPNMSFEERAQAITQTSIDQYIPHMGEMYTKDYRMMLFFSVPNSESGATMTVNKGYKQKSAKFQATFRKLLPEELGEQWELHNDKTVLVSKKFSAYNSGTTWNTTTQSSSATDSNPLVEKLNMITERGGRLIAIELSQMGGQQATMQHAGAQEPSGSGTVPKMQVPVDIFYELPRHQYSERYKYHVVNCPMVSTSFQGRAITLWSSNIDWEGVMAQFLGTGWRLVEIFEDASSVSTGTVGGFGNQKTKQNNCLWIFEKPMSRINDNTPYYEGTKVETQFTVSVSIGFSRISASSYCDWDNLMNHYGQNGWQVVRFLRTPDTKTTQSFPPTVHQRVMMFAQRLIEGRVDVPGAAPPIDTKSPQGPFPEASAPFPNQPPGAVGPNPPTAPPAYSDLYSQ